MVLFRWRDSDIFEFLKTRYMVFANLTYLDSFNIILDYAPTKLWRCSIHGFYRAILLLLECHSLSCYHKAGIAELSYHLAYSNVVLWGYGHQKYALLLLMDLRRIVTINRFSSGCGIGCSTSAISITCSYHYITSTKQAYLIILNITFSIINLLLL
jgi:hypothetical protein